MKEQLQKRLHDLRTEFDSGQKMLADLEMKQMNLRNTLMRISGAIQVIEEELTKESKGDQNEIGNLGGMQKTEPIVE